MSKFSIILCAVFLVSVVTAKDADAIKKCTDSIEDASESIWSAYGQLPLRKNDEEREELYKLAENGDVTLEKIIDEVKKAETLAIEPVPLPSYIDDVTIQCSKEVGDTVVQIVTGTVNAMTNYA